MQFVKIVYLAVAIVLLGFLLAKGAEQVCPTCDARTLYYTVGILVGLLWKYVR